MHTNVFRIVAAIALLTGPAYAQQAPQLNAIEDWSGTKQKEKDAAVAKEKAYQESLKKIPDAKVSADPWGNARMDTPKASAPAKPRTTTGSTAN
jgi:hypothetical protein